MAITSLYGTDGCGKSTIAVEMHSNLAERRPIVLGGSSYKQWLTPSIAYDFMGDKHTFAEAPDSPEAETILYEDIAIVCYGLANRLALEGNEVIIDSDPYLKRLVWGTLGKDVDEAKTYITHFSERVDDHLSLDVAPNSIIGINVSSHADADHAAKLLERLSLRGENSAHDPDNLRDITALDNHIRTVWGLICRAPGASTEISPILEPRLRHTLTYEYENPQCTPSELPSQIKNLARMIGANHIAIS